MQFNLRDGPPSTWARYGVDANHDGSRDVYDPADAIPSAANYLRALLRRADGNLSRAILGYNHSPAYVGDVLARARAYAGVTDDELAAPVDNSTPAIGCADGALWILRRYHLRVSAALEAGHHIHGDGTAVDLVPADGNTQAVWDGSAGRLAHDLGWTPACARSGTRPACRLAPAIQFIGYDGYPSHGSPRVGAPRTCTSRGPRRAMGPATSPPCEWVTAFTVLPTGSPAAGGPGSQPARGQSAIVVERARDRAPARSSVGYPHRCRTAGSACSRSATAPRIPPRCPEGAVVSLDPRCRRSPERSRR